VRENKPKQAESSRDKISEQGLHQARTTNSSSGADFPNHAQLAVVSGNSVGRAGALPKVCVAPAVRSRPGCYSATPSPCLDHARRQCIFDRKVSDGDPADREGSTAFAVGTGMAYRGDATLSLYASG